MIASQYKTHICAVVQQQLDHRAIALLRGNVEDGVATILSIVGVKVEPLLAQKDLPKRHATPHVKKRGFVVCSMP